MTKRQYRRYTKEFKLEAIRLADEADKPVTDVARELGIRVNQIYKWKRQLETKQADAFPGHGKQLGEAAELTRLKREIARLKEENEILKKAATYFAREAK
jgi:transposase-like protein